MMEIEIKHIQYKLPSSEAALISSFDWTPFPEQKVSFHRLLQQLYFTNGKRTERQKGHIFSLLLMRF